MDKNVRGTASPTSRYLQCKDKRVRVSVDVGVGYCEYDGYFEYDGYCL